MFLFNSSACEWISLRVERSLRLHVHQHGHRGLAESSATASSSGAVAGDAATLWGRQRWACGLGLGEFEPQKREERASERASERGGKSGDLFESLFERLWGLFGLVVFELFEESRAARPHTQRVQDSAPQRSFCRAEMKRSRSCSKHRLSTSCRDINSILNFNLNEFKWYNLIFYFIISKVFYRFT